ncbi:MULTISPECIES: ABC transporter substrate-binding protein [Bradyrhizobium]|jgi:branched-chain amino acid transport system substrate-binding protein|uniref:ABC-type branched-chain amino acid transport system, substrate-binding protein n=2 Tax=Bradyrhizobium TaxID=374 RepID=A0ABY0PDN3_9BRAD|nr:MULTISPECIES: ABC transporter substrate-binding protein [Bradyrhizobium]SDI16748.1 ABC-type branched-chain amino acid transport system, substrate-binding protein [Bradyrhizobium ottawaense]SED77294.1 ABC-type branched-chain amino acid transport system, substrate-binding protein [Bradyrhizobium lablabi]SHL72877.1 ABC-type branched-chain amino acid transport system, substrate-binding protein [Bradyrhizobium lablabi]
MTQRRILLDRRAFLGGAAALGAGALSGRAFAADGAFNIGWIRPTTGRLASSYAPLYIGGLIAIDDINASGGVMSRKIARQEEDDEASPAREPAVIKKLQESGVRYICGPTGSSQSLAALAVTTPAKTITTMYAIASEAGDGTRYPWHYQCTFNSDLQAEMASRYLVETLKLKKIGILQENTAYGEQVVAACQAVLKKLGVTPVGVEVFPITAPDLNGYVGNLRKAGADGVLFWTGSTPITAKGFNSMHAQKYYPAIAGHSALFADSLLDLVPAEALQNAAGTYYKTLTWTDKEAIGARQLEFAKKANAFPETKETGVNVAASPFYDFLHMLRAAIESEKSFDPEKVKRAMDATKNYNGLLGTLNFTATNHAAISIEDMTMATLLSGRDPTAMAVFRKRAV